MCIFFLCKQKTAYEMRISDWSSDVFSSDLLGISASPAGSADRRRLRAAAALVRVEARDSQGLWLAPHGALRAGGAARRDRLVDGRIGLDRPAGCVPPPPRHAPVGGTPDPWGLVWTALDLSRLADDPRARPARYAASVIPLTILLVLQILLGAFTAGLNAGFAFNSWPLMGDRWFPENVPMLAPYWQNLVDNPVVVQFAQIGRAHV